MILLQPGMELLNKLSFAKKFHLILATFVIPILYAGFVIYSDKSAEVKAGEAEALGYAVVKLVQPLQQLASRHRSLHGQYLAGVSAVETELKSLEQGIAQQLSKVGKSVKSLGYSNYVSKAWQTAEGHWADLRSSGNGDSATEKSFTKHSRWIKEVGDVIKLIATESGLVLDSYLDSYTLMELVVFDLPRVDEYVGQLLARGVVVAAKGNFTPDSYVGMTTVYDALTLAKSELDHKYTMAMDTHPEFVDTLKQPLSNTIAAIDKLLRETKSQLLDPDQPQLSPSQYDALGQSTLASLKSLALVGSSTFERLVAQHRASSQFSMMLALTLFTVLMLVSAYLLTALKRTVDDNAQMVQTMATD